MDWKVFLTTFGILFLAEFGDKTQLAVLTMTAQTSRPVAVFLGAIVALSGVTLLAVIFGHVVQQWIPREIIGKVAGVLFFVVGALVFFGKL
jgi:putative Ca2+/H+ antiporter (TMEM165/GDT1 family)